jgi:hypothetical protein
MSHSERLKVLDSTLGELKALVRSRFEQRPTPRAFPETSRPVARSQDQGIRGLWGRLFGGTK